MEDGMEGDCKVWYNSGCGDVISWVEGRVSNRGG